MMADKGRTPTLRPCGPTKAWSRIIAAAARIVDAARAGPEDALAAQRARFWPRPIALANLDLASA